MCSAEQQTLGGKKYFLAAWYTLLLAVVSPGSMHVGFLKQVFLFLCSNSKRLRTQPLVPFAFERVLLMRPQLLIDTILAQLMPSLTGKLTDFGVGNLTFFQARVPQATQPPLPRRKTPPLR